MPKTLKDFVNRYKHIDDNTLDSNKNSFFNNYVIEIFFVTALISLIVMIVVLYIVCKHAKLKSLVTSIALQQNKGMDATFDQDLVNDVHCTCKIQWHTTAMLLLILLVITFVITINFRKLRLFRGYLFPNIVKVMLFISDAQYYVPIKFCRVVGSIHLFKLGGNLRLEHVTLKKNLIWDVLELDWKDVSVTLHGNKINFPTSVIIPCRDKFRIR